MAAGGVEAAHLAGQKGNALVATEPRADLIEAFVSAGGSGRAMRRWRFAMPSGRMTHGRRRIAIFGGRRPAAA
jgi:hypothetical protein